MKFSDFIVSFDRKVFHLPDKLYLKALYKIKMGSKLNLKNPKTFNEKLQWLKLYYRKQSLTNLVDKYEAKQFFEKTIGEKYVIPTIGIYEHFSDIDFSSLPKEFVIKCTHDNNSVVICRDKDSFDFDAARKRIEEKQRINFFYWGREWPYKNVKPRIIIESFLPGLDDESLVEYKIFCFNGKPKIVLVCKGTAHMTDGSRTNDWMDDSFNRLPFLSLNPWSKPDPIRPKEMDEMLVLAEKLSSNLPLVRVDFYLTNGNIYIGEMTFFHNSGFCKFEPDEWDYKLGKLIVLPEQKIQ